MKLLKDQSILPTLMAALEGREAVREGPYEATTSSARIWATLRAAPLLGESGAVEGGIGIVEDTTDRHHAVEALQESWERLEMALEGAGLAMWDWNLVTQDVVVDARWYEMLGYAPNEMAFTQRVIEEHVHPEEMNEVRGVVEDHLAGRTPVCQVVHRMRTKSGGWRWISTRGRIVQRDPSGKPLRAAGTSRDVTEHRLAEERLARSAFYDRLTDLPNRALVLDRLGMALRRTELHPSSRCAVLLVDIDRFQIVNDSLGHRAGDELLKEVVRRVEGLLRPNDTLGRLGSDSFLVVLDDLADDSSPIRVAERIRKALDEPFHLEGHQHHVTVSTGIAIASLGVTAPEDLLRDADTAMNRAKGAGRDCFVLFDEAMHQTAVSRLDLENALRRSVERGEIQVWYQPSISLADGRITGAEALVRWQHPRRGLLMPTEFVPIAEETGLIVAIGRFVLNEACRQVVEWNTERPGSLLRMSVNLSAKQLAVPTLVEEVRATLEATGLDAQLLRLEITESVLLGRPEEALAVLTRLRVLGVQLALDDFGTGYSSLGYLVRFPVQELKLDRSFVSRVHHGEREAAVARAVVRLARDLAMTVTAEGVETEEQLSWLRDQGVDQAQGFLLSRPIRAAEFQALLARS